jgi:hypothetical protein
MSFPECYSAAMDELKVFASRAVIHNGRRVEPRFAEVNGRLVCIGLEIGPHVIDFPDKGETFVNVQDDDLRPLTASEMRLPLRSLIDLALEHAVMVRAGSGDFTADERAFAADLDVLKAAQSEPRKRTGRPPIYPPEHFAEVARVYSEHLADGGRTPTKAVQEHFAPVSKSAAAKWVARARERGLLESTEAVSDDG